MFVIDTNIFIYHTAGDTRIRKFMESTKLTQGDIIVPSICILEFLSYEKIVKTDRENFLLFTEQFEILPLDLDNALSAAELRLEYGLKVVDSIVAAAAITQNAILVSRDKDFRKVKEIEVIDL